MDTPQYHQSGSTYFVVQEGDALAGCFFDDACCHYYLVRLLHSLHQFRVNLHAYCLLPDRAYYLITPQTPNGIDRLLRAAMAQYRSYYARRFARVAKHLGKRVSSRLISDDESALRHQIGIEQQPLLAKLVTHAGMYRWSSYSSNAFGLGSGHLQHHPAFASFLGEMQHPHRSYHQLINQCSLSIGGQLQNRLRSP